MVETVAAVTALTDKFCATYLNEEYRAMIHRVVGTLARKRPSPLLRGKENVWACAAVHVVGRVNYLDDSSRTPHCKPKLIYAYFGVAESTGQSKSKEVRGLLKMGTMAPEWTLPSQIAGNPRVWILQVNGMGIDMRYAPLEMQRQAFAQGLIPYIPATRVSDE